MFCSQIQVEIPLRNLRRRKYRRVDHLYMQRILYARNKIGTVAHQTQQEISLCQVIKCRPRRIPVSTNLSNILDIQIVLA